jgi:hypothetical protein
VDIPAYSEGARPSAAHSKCITCTNRRSVEYRRPRRLLCIPATLPLVLAAPAIGLFCVGLSAWLASNSATGWDTRSNDGELGGGVLILVGLGVALACSDRVDGRAQICLIELLVLAMRCS